MIFDNKVTVVLQANAA